MRLGGGVGQRTKSSYDSWAATRGPAVRRFLSLEAVQEGGMGGALGRTLLLPGCTSGPFSSLYLLGIWPERPEGAGSFWQSLSTVLSQRLFSHTAL